MLQVVAQVDKETELRIAEERVRMRVNRLMKMSAMNAPQFLMDIEQTLIKKESNKVARLKRKIAKQS